MHVVSVTVKPVVTDCTGTFWFTDLMIQEASKLTGYVPNTETALKSYATDDEYAVIEPLSDYGIVRGGATCIIFNPGKTSTGVDWKNYPNQDMEEESVTLAMVAEHIRRFLRNP